MLASLKKQQGFSILEAIVAIGIATIVIFAVMDIFSSTITGSQRILESGKLERDLSATMDIIVSDVQRAGYWANATTSATANPFMLGTDDITVTASCVTYTYDRAADGTLSDTDKFGFRLNGNTIQFRPADGTGANFTCAAAAGLWTPLTDPNVVTISAFTTTLSLVGVNPTTGVSTSGSCPSPSTCYRTLTLTITGALTNASTVTKTITRTINLYNNKYVP